jgi:hypothetical protein
MALEGKTGGRLVRGFLRRVARDPTAWGLIAFNLAAGVIVLLRPPYTQPLFFLYWGDCILVGLFGALKLFFVPVRLGSAADEHRVTAFILRAVAKIFLAALFLFVYGYLLVCATALLGGIAGEEARIRPAARLDESSFLGELGLPVGALLVGHLFSFIGNFLGKREYRRRTVEDQIVRPLGRVLPLLFVLMLGGFVLSVFRFPALLVAVFILGKIAADLAGHFWEHGFPSP